MIKIESPFTLTETPPRYLRVFSGSPSLSEFTTKIVTLRGLEISLQIGGRTYDLSSTGALAQSGLYRNGFGWARQLVPLGADMALEQQVFLANAGNTIIASWRLTGGALHPVRLTAAPIFAAAEPTSSEGFRFEAESNGGRLIWQPFHRAARIVADTNGRVIHLARSADSGNHCSGPGAFEFELARRPAVLILSVEAHDNRCMDPVIGSFLAQIASPGSEAAAGNIPARLAAA